MACLSLPCSPMRISSKILCDGPYVVDTLWKRLIEMLQMSTHNKCFHEKIRMVIFLNRSLARSVSMVVMFLSRDFTLRLPVTTFVVYSSLLLMFLGSLYCKQYGPRSDCSLWSSLISVHIVCFHDKI